MIDDKGEQVKTAGPSTPVQVLGLSVGPGGRRRVPRRPGREDRPHRRRGPRVPPADEAPAWRRPGQDRRQAGGHLRPDPVGRDGDAQPRPQGRRPRLAGGGHREPAQARPPRGRADVRAPRRRRHHRERHLARRHHQRHDHRLQRAPGPQGPRARRRRGRRDPHLRDHLQAARGHRAGDGRHAGAGVRRGRHRRGRGPRDLPGARGSARSPAATCARASSPVARRSASCATARSSGRARSPRCERFKDDAREVREGFECGIGLSDFQDLKPGDLIETFEEQEIART